MNFANPRSLGALLVAFLLLAVPAVQGFCACRMPGTMEIREPGGPASCAKSCCGSECPSTNHSTQDCQVLVAAALSTAPSFVRILPAPPGIEPPPVAIATALVLEPSGSAFAPPDPVRTFPFEPSAHGLRAPPTSA